MKKSQGLWFRSIFLLITMLLMSSVVSAQKAGSTPVSPGTDPTTEATDEPDDGQDNDNPQTGDLDPSVLNLPLLADGDTIELDFSGSDGARLVAFNASAGDAVNIYMTQAEGSSLDPYLAIFGSRGRIIASDDDSGEEALSSFIGDLEIEEDGTYFILATTFGARNFPLSEDGSDLAFTITVEGNSVPADIPEGSFAYAVLQTEIGETLALEFEDNFPAFFFTFEGNAGDEVTVYAPSEDVDTLLMVFDYTGARIGVDDDSGEVPLAAEIADLELPVDGVYFGILTYYSYVTYPVDGLDVGGEVELSIE